MNFDQLLYAEVLARYNSMQKAADILHISKSGLSLAINQLEEELSIKLFFRNNRGTQLTEEGRQLLSSISDILRSKNKLENTATLLASPLKHQKIKIHYMNTMLKPFIESFIRDYSTKYLHTDLDISCHEIDSIVRRLHSQEIDAGFIAINDPNSTIIGKLEFSAICDSKLVLLCSPQNALNHLKRPISLEDLKKQKFSLFNDNFHDLIFEKLQYQCGPLSLVLRVDDAWAMNEAIEKLNTVCFGRTLQSDLSSNNDFSKLKTIDIGHIIDDNFKLGWLTNPNHMLSEETQELITAISLNIKKDAQK